MIDSLFQDLMKVLMVMGFFIGLIVVAAVQLGKKAMQNPAVRKGAKSVASEAATRVVNRWLFKR